MIIWQVAQMSDQTVVDRINLKKFLELSVKLNWWTETIVFRDSERGDRKLPFYWYKGSLIRKDSYDICENKKMLTIMNERMQNPLNDNDIIVNCVQRPKTVITRPYQYDLMFVFRKKEAASEKVYKIINPWRKVLGIKTSCS